MKKDLILFTNEIEKAKEEIVSLGGHVTQQFTKHVFIANLPDKVDSKKLRESTSKRPSDLDEVSDLVTEAWENSQKESTSQAPSKSEGLSWDAPGYEPPNFIKNDDQNTTLKIQSDEVEGSSHTPTSRYMIGSISVGLVIVSGTDAELEFSTAERLKVINEVQKGLNFLANAEPRAKITFKYDIRLVTVTARPGATSSYETAESPWRNAALQQMGFGASRQGSVDYVNQLRRNNNTDWAYVAYFTKYPLHHFAYAVTERLVMHYHNNGWGVDNINKVFAHETCHIFGAADEYGSCRCDSIHGHLGIQNKNCKNCDGNHESCLMDGNTLQLCKWSRKQIGWDESLYPEVSPPLGQGLHTIQQKSSGRYLDAYETTQDFTAVTRTAQNDDSQKWRFTLVGTLYTIQQKSSSRYLDAYETAEKDFDCVTRTSQNDDTQRWAIMSSPSNLGAYTLQQLVNGRFLDAYESNDQDFRVVTRANQNNSSQRWLIDSLGADTYTLRQQVNGRFLDAHESNGNDFTVVTRTAQNDDSQKWILKPIGGIYTIQQKITGILLDAYVNSNDSTVVTRPAQYDDTQRWVVKALGSNTYTIQQLIHGQFLDAYESNDQDFRVVTRANQNDDTQKWIIK